MRQLSSIYPNHESVLFLALGLCACSGTGISPGWPQEVQQSSSQASTVVRLQQSEHAMGTTYVLDLYGSDRHLLETAEAQAFEEVHRLDEMLSNYIPKSELSRVNEHAADGPVHVSQELFDLLTECLDYSRASEGAFDITVGPLMKAWGFYEDFGHLPRDEELRAAREVVGYQNIELNPEDHAIRFKKRGLNLDPGGVGKGYAVDKMVAILRQAGIRSGLVSAGGSSIYAIGARPNDARGWPIQIRDPENENKTVSDVYLKDASLSTSGSTERYFWAAGKRYGHIMDPRTGYPATGVLSVSIVAPRTLDSEVWAKPYYVLGRGWTERHKKAGFRVFMCEDKPGASCEWLP